MSLFYRNNMLNSFLHRYDKDTWPSPLCSCEEDEQTALHILTNCPIVGAERIEKAKHIMQVCNDTVDFADADQNPFAIINCSRDASFIELCLESVELERLHLKRKVQLRSKN